MRDELTELREKIARVIYDEYGCGPDEGVNSSLNTAEKILSLIPTCEAEITRLRAEIVRMEAVVRAAEEAHRIMLRDEKPPPQPPRDYACSACCIEPYARDSVVEGFRCWFHALDAALAEYRRVK